MRPEAAAGRAAAAAGTAGVAVTAAEATRRGRWRRAHFGRSGVQVILVQPSHGPSLMVGLPTFIMLSLKTCLNFLPSAAAAVRGAPVAREGRAPRSVRGLQRARVRVNVRVRVRTVRRLDGEFGREDVGELGAVAVASARRLLLLVVEVGAGEQVACAHAPRDHAALGVCRGCSERHGRR